MKYLLEYKSWGNDDIESLYNYLKGFENGDPSVMESILMDSTESTFMIKLYLKFCEVYDVKPFLKYDFMGSIMGKRSLDRYIDIEKLKKQDYYKSFLRYLNKDNLKDYFQRYFEADQYPCWFYFINPQLIKTQCNIIHYSMGDLNLKGISDYNKLGATTKYDKQKSENGFIFGFLKEDLKDKKIFYGKNENTLSVDKLIRFYHLGDKEYQCVFSINDINRV